VQKAPEDPLKFPHNALRGRWALRQGAADPALRPCHHQRRILL